MADWKGLALLLVTAFVGNGMLGVSAQQVTVEVEQRAIEDIKNLIWSSSDDVRYFLIFLYFYPTYGN